MFSAWITKDLRRGDLSTLSEVVKGTNDERAVALKGRAALWSGGSQGNGRLIYTRRT
jgi:hypothetical protein